MAVAREAGLTAAILCFVFAVWPLIAFLGGSGLSPLMGIAALATAHRSIPRVRFQFYMLALGAFVAFAAASTMWSPRPFVLVEVSSLSIRSEVLRWGLLMAAGGGLIAATRGLTDRGAGLVLCVTTIALAVQFVMTIGIALFEEPLLDFFYAGRSNDDGVQNITRNGNYMAAAAPFLILALTEGRGRILSGVISTMIVIAVCGVAALRDLDAGYLTLAAALGAYLLVRLFGRQGLRLLGGLLAMLVLAAPWIFQLIAAGANAVTATSSLQYRQVIWQRTLDIIWQNPIQGAGVGALRMERDLVPSGVFEGQLIIPNHPHNMLLQLWAETGLIGAILAAATILLVAWRLPRPELLGPAAPRIAVIVGAFCASLVSFDLWNESWWAVFGLLAVLTAVHYRLRVSAINAAAAAPVSDHEREWRGAVPEPTFANAAMQLDPSPDPQIAHVTAPVDTVNNFNLMRLIFALMVVSYHIIVAVPDWKTAFYPQMALVAEVGVQGFFILSGYLVYASLERSSSIKEFAEKRFRRVYPAYAFVILACAGAALVVSPVAREDLIGVARYTGWNLIFANFMEPSLPGVFAGNPVTEVNGALWTLKIAVMFYLFLPILLWLLRLGGGHDWIGCILIYVGAEVWRASFNEVGQFEIARQLPGQLSFFLTGMMLQAANLSGSRLHIAGLAGGVLFVASLLLPSAEFARAIGLGAFIVWLATGAFRLPDPARFGDLSYGIYIVHAPIIQVCVATGVFAIGATVGAGVAVAAAVIAAFVLWHLVERPFLRRDSAYRIGRK